MPSPASDRIRQEWLRRVEAEYRSSAITQQLTLWLTQLGASPDLIRDGLRISDDELAHAELSFATYAAAGGTDAPRLARETLGVAESGDGLEADIVRTTVDVFCLGETVAVPLFRHLRERCTATEARAALDRILLDEVRHRDFGWTTLEWLLAQPIATDVRAQLDRELSLYFRRLRNAYGRVRATTDVTEEEAAWGLMAPHRYAEIVDRTWERDYEPRFRKLGVDARNAWEAGVG